MSRLISLRGVQSTLHLALPERGMPVILGWTMNGHDLSDQAPSLAVRSHRINGMDDPPPTAVLLPTGGMGNFMWPAIQGHRDGRDWICEFSDWEEFGDGDDAGFMGYDRVAGLRLTIWLELQRSGALKMNTRLSNMGDTPYQLDRCMAGTMLLDPMFDRLIHFEGSWGREFQRRETRLGSGLWIQENRRGRTSHDRSPTVFFQSNHSPRAYGLHLGASGNHVIAIDRLDDGRRLVHAGELFEPGEMRLAPGEDYDSPAVHMTFSEKGLEGVTARFYEHVRDNIQELARPISPRPVTLNTWEGNYFAHDRAHLKAQASAAAALGIERFVLDDGWFGRRDDDTSSLGDWYVDTRKYPDGLMPLIAHVKDLGMEFGLWLEPEMISPDSDLYRAHPDWALHVAGRPLTLSRHQLVLDLTRPEVFEHLYGVINALLREYPIDYIKWDMNRDLTAAAGQDGRAVTSRQTKAFYDLVRRIRVAHPSLEIESCSSGGARIDYGVLGITHRVWLSDCTDALERLTIQDGASLFLPPEIIGSHVSASPNHQTGRRHSLAFRAIVALAYHFGVELNPLTLSDTERDELAGWIALHKRLRPLLHAPGKGFRHPVYDSRHIYGAVDEEAGQAVILIAQTAQMLQEQPIPVRLPVTGKGRWRVSAMYPPNPDFIRIVPTQTALFSGEIVMGAGDLAVVGLPIPALRPETAVLIELRAED